MLSEKTVAFLLVSTVECLLLLLYRMIVSNSETYEYMVWNLALGWTPLVISTIFVSIASRKKSPYRPIGLGICFLSWLLFFPNAPYLITDIVHLQPMDAVPLWFDLLLLESYGLAGFFLTYVSLFQIQHVFAKVIGNKNSVYASVVLLYVASIGVSIGRFWRFNSWDIIIAPWRIIGDFFVFSFSPERVVEIVSFSTFFFFLLITLYVFLTVLRERSL